MPPGKTFEEAATDGGERPAKELDASRQGHLPGVSAEIEGKIRDSWCTPEWLWRIPLEAMGLDHYDLDPCSNEWSTVPADWKICPPQDGLFPITMWAKSVIWLNPPYSNVGPWFDNAQTAADGSGSLIWGVVPHAPSTEAWKDWGPDAAWSLGRVSFVPPPGVKPSTPNQEHTLVCWWSKWTPRVNGRADCTVFEVIDAHPRTLYSMRRAA